MVPVEIRKVGDPILWKGTDPVADIDSDLISLANGRMKFMMKQARGHGIAAPQIGVRKRLFTYEYNGPYQIVVNPEIIESDGVVLMREGCLSVPDLFVELERPERLHLQALGLDGTLVEREVDGFEARIILHELDHLNGLTIFDRMDEDQLKTVRNHPLFGIRPAWL